MTAQALTDRAGLGIVLMLVAWFLFSLVDTSVKWLVVFGFPATQLAFMRYFGHFIISLAKISSMASPNRFAIAHPVLVIVRAVLLVSGTTMNFYILNYLPLTLTSAVMFSAPILVCLLSWPLLGERVGPWRTFAIVLGFVGVLIHEGKSLAFDVRLGDGLIVVLLQCRLVVKQFQLARGAGHEQIDNPLGFAVEVSGPGCNGAFGWRQRLGSAKRLGAAISEQGSQGDLANTETAVPEKMAASPFGERIKIHGA